MAAQSSDSSALRDSTHATFSAPPVEFSSLAQMVNFNLPLTLDKDNYIHWKAQVLPVIQAFELDDFVSNVRPSPPKYIEVLSSNGSDKEVIANKEYMLWRKADKQLQCWLLSTIHPSILGEVTSCKTSQEVWTTLENLFSQQSMAKVLQLKQQLLCLKKGANTVSEFMLKVKSIGDSLKATGEVVRDNDLILSILNGIGHEYDPVAVLISLQKQTMSLQEVQCQLMIHK
ncbi:hypothetical protein ACOSQ2_003737 [Xanthoceras sorbifolium]